MSEVKVKAEIGAPAARVWGLIKGFGEIAKWAGAGIQSCEVEGEGVGAVRTLGLPGGGSLQERLEAYDETGRTLSYSIIGENPLPLTDYRSTMKVAEAGSGRCTLEWSGRFEPKGDEAQAKSLIEGIYNGGITGIKSTLGA